MYPIYVLKDFIEGIRSLSLRETDGDEFCSLNLP